MEELKYYSNGLLRPIFNKSGMKQIINSGFKEFDKQTNCLSQGNIISNTLYGNYIRPFNMLKNPVGQDVEPGVLTRYDLQHFNNLPKGIRDMLMSENRKDSYILYELHIYRNGSKEILGYIMTDKNYKLRHKEVNRSVLPYSVMYDKRWAALCEVQKYVCVT